MGVFLFSMGPQGDNPPQSWSSGILWLWGKLDSSPEGTCFHFKLIPQTVPAAFQSSGKSLVVEWLRPQGGDGASLFAWAEGWESPAVMVRTGGGEPPPDWNPPELRFRELIGGTTPWEDTYNGVPVPPQDTAWEWYLGAMFRVCYPLDWVSPTPSTDIFTFSAELWSSKEVPNPQDPQNPLKVPDAYLYTLPDTGEARMDHPVMGIRANAYGGKWLCPGMAGVQVHLEVTLPHVWVNDPQPLP